jgi:hypothetical protein
MTDTLLLPCLQVDRRVPCCRVVLSMRTRALQTLVLSVGGYCIYYMRYSHSFVLQPLHAVQKQGLSCIQYTSTAVIWSWLLPAGMRSPAPT